MLFIGRDEWLGQGSEDEAAKREGERQEEAGQQHMQSGNRRKTVYLHQQTAPCDTL
jgi:hypothetical protein